MNSSLRSVAFALLLASVALAACSDSTSDCDRSGCQAVNQPAPDTGQSALAGVVATESDVVANGCQECPLGSVKLEFRKLAAPITDSATAQAWIDSHAPDSTLAATGHWAQALDPGHYLVCVPMGCANVEVLPLHVTTMNLLLPFGRPRFIVFEPGATIPRTEPTL